METVNFREVDSTEEICKVFNRVIDNQNQIEGKLLTLIDSNKKLATKSWVGKLLAPKKSSKEKGFTMLKTMLVTAIMAVMLFVGTADAYVAKDINDSITSNHVILTQYLRDVVGAGTFAFTPQSAPTAGSISQGLVYFDSSVNLLKVSLDGTNFSTIDTAGGVSLDGAYDFGSAGGGRTINATDGAVQITNTQNDTASLLGLTYSGNTTGDGLTITMSVGSGDAIEIENTGTGADIEGTGDLWSVTKAGLATFGGGMVISTADVLFDATDAGKDVQWDDSIETFHFLDNAILGIGGAVDNAGDVTFTHDGSDFIMDAAIADEAWLIGDTTSGFDISIRYETSGTIATDYDGNIMTFDGVNLIINDDDKQAYGDSLEFSIEYDEDSTDNLLIVALNANDAVQFGDGTSSSTDVKMMASTDGDFVLFDSSADELFFEDVDLKINEGAQIEFSVADNSVDWTIDVSTDETLLFLPTETTDDQTFNVGNATNTSDIRFFGATASTVVFDASADAVLFDVYNIALGDGDSILFGDTLGTGDFGITDTSDVLVINNIVDGTGTIGLGAVGAGIDVAFHGDAGSGLMLWDENANTNGALVFNNADVEMGDGDFIQLGDGADLTISATTITTTMTMAAGSVLTIADTDNVASLLTFGVSGGTHGLDVLFQGSTAGDIVDWDAGNDTWNFGVDATGVDVVFHSNTTLKLMNWIEATNILSLDGDTAMLEFRGANVDTHETTLAVVEPTKSNIVNLPDDTGELSYIAEGGTVAFGPTGAIPLTDAVVLWTSTGADAISLPDGTSAGQILSIVLIAQAGGASTLTPDSVTGSGWATMVFTNVGESATFLYVDSTIGWLCLGTFGVSTQPLITQ